MLYQTGQHRLDMSGIKRLSFGPMEVTPLLPNEENRAATKGMFHYIRKGTVPFVQPYIYFISLPHDRDSLVLSLSRRRFSMSSGQHGAQNPTLMSAI